MIEHDRAHLRSRTLTRPGTVPPPAPRLFTRSSSQTPQHDRRNGGSRLKASALTPRGASTRLVPRTRTSASPEGKLARLLALWNEAPSRSKQIETEGAQ